MMKPGALLLAVTMLSATSIAGSAPARHQMTDYLAGLPSFRVQSAAVDQVVLDSGM